MPTTPDPHTATILEIQRMSTEDGPGIRTTVFFKGCSLRCAWCHNPESIARSPELHWLSTRCIGCLSCIKACPHQALSAGDKGITIARERCTGCGACAEACPSTALELLGRTWSLEELTGELLKDRAYFEKSGGGITLSGGEPTLQPLFAARLLRALQGHGLSTALDTCGACPPQALEDCLEFSDLVLFDLKEIDAQQHARFTGVSNEKILKNFARTCAHLRERGRQTRLWVRTPVIPQATDTPANISGIGAFIAREAGALVERWELCAFNNLCRDKYARLDLPWAYAGCDLLSSGCMEQLARIARLSGVDPEIVHWSGSTRMEKGAGEERHLQAVTPCHKGDMS